MQIDIHFDQFDNLESSSNGDLIPRRGGGSSGGHSGGGHSESSGSGAGKSSGGSAGGGEAGKGVAAGGSGGGKTITIPVGQPFGGRSAGGGTRDQVNGTSTYGSGVPGRIGGPVQGQGLPYFPVAGQAIPFFFWPVDWGNDPDATAYNSTEYKDTTDSPRPGGALVTASINFTAEPGITFRFLADNQTVTEIIPILNGTTCASNLTLSATLAEWVQGGSPEPKAAVQYFRASSAVLTLDSHDIHIDSTKPTGQLYDCLVEKIAASIPLVDPLPKYSRGEKAGIALGTIAGVALLAGLGWCIICRKGKGGETEHKSGLKLEAGLTKSSPLAGSG